MDVSGTALIMAGGEGTRMRQSAVREPKPLVEAGGVTLLERNVQMLLRHGFRDIIVAVPHGIPEIAAFVETRCQALAQAAEARVETLVERTALGNIGCAGLLRERYENLLVVYADNLTTLNLQAIWLDHCESGADLTLAVHDEPFRIPFGRVTIAGDRITAYEEKPALPVPVCSAISVLGPAAVRALPPDKPTGLSGLAQGMIAARAHVRAFRHQAAWIDVNDAEARLRAERLVAAHREAFDLWSPQVRAQAVVVLLQQGDEFLAERCADGLVVPWAVLERSASITDGARQTLAPWLTGPMPLLPRGVYDALDDASGSILRVNVFTGSGAAGVKRGSWSALKPCELARHLRPALAYVQGT